MGGTKRGVGALRAPARPRPYWWRPGAGLGAEAAALFAAALEGDADAHGVASGKETIGGDGRLDWSDVAAELRATEAVELAGTRFAVLAPVRGPGGLVWLARAAGDPVPAALFVPGAGGTVLLSGGEARFGDEHERALRERFPRRARGI